jgi:diphthine-ammonia ligase
MTSIKAAISWSGGNDCCMALLRAREQRIAVPTFVTMCEADGTSMSHALAAEVVAAQVAALGAHWWPVRVPTGGYLRAFSLTLQRLSHTSHTHMVFGHIDLQVPRHWLEQACMSAGIKPLFPLWGEQRTALATEVIKRGIRARLVCVDTCRLDASFCGVEYDAGLLARLPSDVCPFGGNGEFHTFAWNAPGFSQALRLRVGSQRTVAWRSPQPSTALVYQTLDLA